MHNSTETLVLVFLFFIPIVFQIWNALKERSVSEIQKCTTYAFLTQLGIFFYSAGPWSTEKKLAVYCLSVGYLFWVMGTAINRARKVEITPYDRLKIATRNLIGICILYGVYIGISRGMLSSRSSTVNLLALPTALVAIFYFMPLVLRIMWKTSEILDPEIKQIIHQTFGKADIKVKRMYFIELEKIKFHNALVCGPKYGYGPFQRSIFITKSLFEKMTKEEVRAVLLHEASHFRLNHLSKRIGITIAVTLFSVLWILVASAVFRQNTGTYSNLITTLFIVSCQIVMIHFVLRNHEYEADLEAVRLGAQPDALISALKKIHELSGVPTQIKTDWVTKFLFQSIHPHIEERESVLKLGVIPKRETRKPFAFSALAVAILFASHLTVSTTNRIAKKDIQNSNLRSPASVRPVMEH